ncbi:MAG: argininosuccinate synthase [Nannocystaceae bacterium]
MAIATKKVALAYSGGLDTSAIVPWLIEHHDCEVIAVVADVGQGDGELRGIREKARQSGASECHILDLKQEFIERYAFALVQSGASYENGYLLGTAIARPIIAKGVVEVALARGADTLAHGCTGKGNDQVRFETVFAALAPHLKVIAPWRLWNLRSREQLLDYIHSRNIPCSATVEKIYSRDANLWHISHEGGNLEDPWNAPSADMWMITEDPQNAPEHAEEVLLEYEEGRPRKVNGEALQASELVARLNQIAGRHGVGRVDLVENRLVGIKSRGCYETPGGTLITAGLAGLTEIALDRDTLHYRQQMSLRFAELIYSGQWFTPLRRSMSRCFEDMAKPLTGEVVISLHRGTCTVIKRRSESSLYSEHFATFGEDSVYDQADAAGFIRLFSLPSRIQALKHSGGIGS